jgi:LmbE family N-acetylglucosaminyl deacetylase
LFFPVKELVLMSGPLFTSESRLLGMLIKPHPEDEVLACGIVLQRAVGAGAAVCIVYATDGDGNPLYVIFNSAAFSKLNSLRTANAVSPP